jgi:hypothetical protein
MGHLSAIGPTAQEAIARAQEAMALLRPDAHHHT